MTRQRRSAIDHLFVLLGVAALSAGALSAQESRGSITGRATDSTGALVTGVKVTATNTETKVATSASTNSTGNYTIFYLIPGMYDLRAEAAGFDAVDRRRVQV